MNLGQRLKKVRLENGLSQGDLTKLCKWHDNSRVSNYERNLRAPSLGDISIMAKALEINPCWLAFELGDKYL